MTSKSPDTRRFVRSVTQAFDSPHPERVLTVAPSLLASDFANLAAELRRMLRARCYWAHLDIMDGHFVPNLTIGPPVVKSVRAVSARLFLDAHLMIEHPLNFLEPFVEAGADLINIHAEAVDDLPAALDTVRKAGVRVGVTLRPRTPVKTIAAVLDQVDLVLIMTVEPGFGGQVMLPNTLTKVRELARLRADKALKFLIEVDGGINAKTVGLAVAAGANVLVAGTAVFSGKDLAGNIETLVTAGLGMGG